MTSSQLSALLVELLALPRETEWVEFKHNNAEAQEIGEYLSALSNAAALHRRDSAYIVWGVDDKTHKVCGTTFRPRRSKGKGNEDLEPWLIRGLAPQVQFEFHTWEHQGHPVVMLRVASATHTPVAFYGERFIRIGSYKKPLKGYPAKEAALWATFSRTPFEQGVAKSDVALIHQDFTVTGAGPMVEIFPDRMEISNPGEPLVDTLRFIDTPPRSRNEDLAALMRRMNICEEGGTGIDKVIEVVEIFQLPAPDFTAISTMQPGSTRASLFAARKLADMEPRDRIRACYQHACLCQVSGRMMTNATLRKRLGVEQQNYSVVSRIIRDTIDAGLIRPFDPHTSKRYMKYLPFWA